MEDSTGRRPLRGKARQPDDEKLTVVASRNHGGQRLEDYLAAITEQFPSTTRIPVGSSLKLCTLASGEADIYPRLGPTSEWDIGAAQAVLCAAGGRVFCADGESLGIQPKRKYLKSRIYRCCRWSISLGASASTATLYGLVGAINWA